MTREEAIKIFNTVLVFGNYDCQEEEAEKCFEMAIEALEQEPILDKIRAEITKLQTYKMFVDEDTVYVKRDDVLDILDKYKVKGEGGKNDNLTNGDVIKAMFPSASEIDHFVSPIEGNIIYIRLEKYQEIRVQQDWWNAPYKADKEV